MTARVAARKAGLPDADAERIRARMDGMFTRRPGQRGSSPENLAALGEVFAYLMGLVSEARAHPETARGHLATMLAATVDGVPLRDEQIAAELHTIMVTGSETTELAVAATLYYLAEHPQQLAAVRADPALVPHAFAEAIRFDHPTHVLCRAVGEDVEIAGLPLVAGQGVLLVWAAANRDPAVIERPTEFDITRRLTRDLRFGHGQHKCLGEHLAMRMGTIMLEEFFAKVADYTIDHARVAGAHPREVLGRHLGRGRRRERLARGLEAPHVLVGPRDGGHEATHPLEGRVAARGERAGEGHEDVVPHCVGRRFHEPELDEPGLRVGLE